MIKNKKKQKETDTPILALLGRITYTESHRHYIDDQKDLSKYNDDAFSVSKTKQDLKQSQETSFYIVHVNDLPVGYAKIGVETQCMKVSFHKTIVAWKGSTS